MRPMKILRDTNSSCSSRFRNAGERSGASVSGMGSDPVWYGCLVVRYSRACVEPQFQTGQQIRRVNLSPGHVPYPPAPTVTSVNAQGRLACVLARVKQPVFPNGSHFQIQRAVALVVLFGIIG